MAKFHSFLWLSYIPLCVHTTSSLSIHLLRGYLGCFHILAIVNNTGMNIRVHLPFQIVFLLFYPQYMPRSGTVGSYGSSIFSFLRTLHSACYNMCECSATQSCLTLCDPMDSSPPGSSVHGISSKNTGAGCYFLLQGFAMVAAPIYIPTNSATGSPFSVCYCG